MTTGLYAAEYPEHLDKLVLYAPILSGIGEAEITEPFNHNDWAGAAEDFQTKEDGSFDLEVTDPVLIEMFCSSCWHYDGDSSPNAWRKDALVSEDNVLIDLTKITVPTLVICGDKDPYLNMDRVKTSLDLLPDGSELQVIEGGYFHNDGSWVDENTLLITLIGTPQIVVYKIAKEVCTAFHQESVMITSNAVVRFNVHDDPDMLGYKNSGEAGRAQMTEVFKM